MIDIHSHILPGLDDGAKNLETALAMARMAAQSGITDIIATPHVVDGVYDNSSETILQAVANLNTALKEHSIPIHIRAGAEYRLEPDLPRRLNARQLITLDEKGRYLLVELPASMVPDYTSRILYELQLAGITPVMAHPERNQHFIKDTALLNTLKNSGAIMQLTAGSLTGLFGRSIEKNAWRIIDSGYLTVVASDAHSTKGRLPSLKEAVLTICTQRGEGLSHLLCYENPWQLSQGQDLKPSPSRSRRLGWLERLTAVMIP